MVVLPAMISRAALRAALSATLMAGAVTGVACGTDVDTNVDTNASLETADVAVTPEAPTTPAVAAPPEMHVTVDAPFEVVALPDWSAPVRGVVTSPFGERNIDHGGSHHDAVDVGAAMGSDVTAPAELRIRSVRHQERAGLYIVADVMRADGTFSGDGFRFTFAHLSYVAVFEGDRVPKGDVLGTVGLSGSATGPHLHFRVEHVEDGERTAVDPLTLFADGAFAL